MSHWKMLPALNCLMCCSELNLFGFGMVGERKQTCIVLYMSIIYKNISVT